jgi:hypothetical protein
MVMVAVQTPVGIQTLRHNAPNLKIEYPGISGMGNRVVQHQMNQAIVKQVNELMAEQSKVQVQGQTEMLGQFELKSNERNVLSLIQWNYAYTPQMAHGMTFVKALTFDVTTGKDYPLRRLFKPSSPYIARISELIRMQLKERDLPLLGEFKSIRPDQDYYIADKALVIFFQLYEITPYYVGFPMFPISVYQLQDIIEENSPLGRMLPDIGR